MIVGYRRLSGAIGITEHESGTRGMWWEKRAALLAALRLRGHEVHLLSKPTRPSRGLWEIPPPDTELDLLMVEFGGTNKIFFGEDLAATADIITHHSGPAIYLWDDPDLPLPAGMDGLQPWTIWANSPGAERLAGPPGSRVLDFPFASLQAPAPPSVPGVQRFIYMGRPTGRRADLEYLDPALVEVYGRPAEWAAHNVEVHCAPAQPLRSALYARYAGGLALASGKHKRMAWRTGRGTHCILSGTPIVTPEDHPGLARYGHRISQPGQLREVLDQWLELGQREQIVLGQQAAIAFDLPIAIARFAEMGL